MLGIIGAMDIEVDSLKSEMNNPQITTVAGMNFYQGTIYGKEVVVVKCGIGKVNAAVCTQILADKFDIEAVINTGIAGSLNNDIDICDIVISVAAQEHDMDVTPLGYEKGIIPGMETSVFMADQMLIDLTKKSAQTAGLDVKLFEGKVVSGDQFIGTHDTKNALKAGFDGDCAEMEGAAIAHTAVLNQIPFLIIRAISDKADGGAEVDYPAFEKKAAENSIMLLKEMIKNF
jgi:adenosylhomocysteine nucleosidase